MKEPYEIMREQGNVSSDDYSEMCLPHFIKPKTTIDDLIKNLETAKENCELKGDTPVIIEDITYKRYEIDSFVFLRGDFVSILATKRIKGKR